MGTGQGRLTHFIHPRQGVRQPVWWSADELAGHQVDIPTAGSNCWNVCSRVHSIPGMEWIGQGVGDITHQASFRCVTYSLRGENISRKKEEKWRSRWRKTLRRMKRMSSWSLRGWKRLRWDQEV